MTPDDFQTHIHSLGICDCGDSEAALSLLRDLLEVGDMRNDDDEEREPDSFSNLLLDAALPPQLPTRWTTLAWLQSHDVIEHADGNVEGYWLSELGMELLEHMREDKKQETAVAVN